MNNCHSKGRRVRLATAGRRARLAAALLGSTVALFLLPAPLHAQSLQDALAQAYAGNPTLGAGRARLRAVDEQVPQALSGYRPTVSAGASIGRETNRYQFQGGRDGTETNPKTLSLTATQPIFDATVAPAVRRAESTVQAERATLLDTEQTVLLNAATAYLDVLRDQEVLALDVNNERILKRQLAAARDRYKAGEYTRTDVSQAESRLAEAVATRATAEGTLESARAAYARIVGTLPGKLAFPKPAVRLPGTMDEAVSMAQSNHPSVLAASYGEEAQRNAVDQQYGRLMPTVGLSASATRVIDPGRSSGIDYDRQDSLSIMLRVTIPLYQAGLPEAQVREAKHTAAQQRLLIDDARRRVGEAAITAWQALQTARAGIESYRSQIQSAQVALEGVTQEAKVGSRTVLDVLNQEQELLNARVNLVRARHDELAATFQLLAATGQMNAGQLALPVNRYDPKAHYKATRNRWFGTGVGD